ncbi:hypothetical protein D3C84_1208530 [compost metagenome]
MVLAAAVPAIEDKAVVSITFPHPAAAVPTAVPAVTIAELPAAAIAVPDPAPAPAAAPNAPLAAPAVSAVATIMIANIAP